MVGKYFCWQLIHADMIQLATKIKPLKLCYTFASIHLLLILLDVNFFEYVIILQSTSCDLCLLLAPHPPLANCARACTLFF